MDFSDVTKNPEQGQFVGVQDNSKGIGQELNKTMQGVGAMGGSALNSVLLGTPELAVKWASPKTYDAWKQLQAENPVASTIGDIAGYLPGLPEKAVIKGLEKAGGKTAERLLSAYAKPAGLLEAGAKGAFQAGAQTIPRNIVDYTATGNDQYLKDIPSSLMLGGAIGGGGKLLSKGLEKAAPMLRDTALASAGVNNNSIKLFAKAGGRMPANFTKEMEEGAKNTIQKTMNDLNISKVDDIGEDLAGLRPEFQIYNEAANSIDPNAIKTAFRDSKAYKSLVDRYGVNNVEKSIDLHTTELGNSSSMIDRRNYLTEQSAKPPRGVAQTTEANASRQVANEMSGVYDGMIDDAGRAALPDTTDFTTLKKQYRVVTSLLGGRKIGLETFMPEAGSPTASREFLMKMLEKGGAGAAVGGGAGYLNNSEMLSNPDTAAEGAGNIALATLGGGLINKFLPKIASKAINLVDKAGTAGAGMLSKNPMLNEILNNPARAAGGFIKPENAGDQRNQGNANLQTKSVTKGDLLTDPNLQSANPSMLSPDPKQPWKTQGPGANQNPQEVAKNHFWTDNQALYSNMMGNLVNKYYEKGLNNQGVSFESFVQAVKEKSNGFQPDMVAHLIYDSPDKQQKLKTTYAAYKDLTENGNIVDKAIENTPLNQGVNMLAGMTRSFGNPLGKEGSKAAERQNAFNLLVDTAEKLTMKPGIPAKPGMKALIEKEMREAISGGGTQAERKQRVISKLNALGADKEIMEEMGFNL